MNACILGNDMAVQRQNDQKVTSRAHGKIVSTTPKTSFGQISFKAIVEGVGP